MQYINEKNQKCIISSKVTGTQTNKQKCRFTKLFIPKIESHDYRNWDLTKFSTHDQNSKSNPGSIYHDSDQNLKFSWHLSTLLLSSLKIQTSWDTSSNSEIQNNIEEGACTHAHTSPKSERPNSHDAVVNLELKFHLKNLCCWHLR